MTPTRMSMCPSRPTTSAGPDAGCGNRLALSTVVDFLVVITSYALASDDRHGWIGCPVGRRNVQAGRTRHALADRERDRAESSVHLELGQHVLHVSANRV